MQPCSREMQVQGMGATQLSGIAAQMELPELPNGHSLTTPFDHTGSAAAGHDDFFDQMLSGLPSAWAELGSAKSPWDASDGNSAVQRIFEGAGKSPEEGFRYAAYDESTLLANRLRQYQISGGGSPAGKTMMLPLSHQQILLAASGESSLLPLPLTLGSGGSADSPNRTVSDGLYNGFSGSLTESANQQSFHHSQGVAMSNQNFGSTPPAAGLGQTSASAASGAASVSAGTGPPRQKVRARRGQATDPHSIAERMRRERIAERMKALQELVPNANKSDKASMLDEIIDYVKFLQLQVKVLSMSRLGGAAAVAPLVADISSEGQGGAGRGGANSSGAAGNDSLTVTEHQVAKLMEEDMGSAMQYLQGKGLCLMPISLASAISSATASYPRPLLTPGAGDALSSPGASALTAHSALANGASDGSETVVVSKA